MKKANEPEIVTFGCRLNVFEGEVMRGAARRAGLENAVIFNTCAVTAEATRQARQAIRRMARDHPGRQIIVTGCAAQIAPEDFADMPQVARVVGNQEKLKVETWARAVPENRNETGALVEVDDIMERASVDASMVEGLEGRTRAFVQVQNGCDHRCTFCIIPYGRGPSASVPQGAVVEQVRRLVGNGFREVVLTGIDINSYGPDLPGRPKLGRLVEQILAHVPELERLRFGTLDPAAIDDKLFDLMVSDPRVMPHAHFSMQAGDDMILKRMKRRHLRAEAIGLTKALKKARPEIMFGADFIAGFPTETDEMFESTLGFVDEADLTFLHVFPYSVREGTPAAKMPQVPGDIIRARAARLRAKGDEALARHLARQVGTRQKTLVERDDFGHTDQYTRLRIEGGAAPGSLCTARITGHDGKALIGEIDSVHGDQSGSETKVSQAL
jgi:threonylcarbamoyladenosine tRNA methylthiotransferase MtaB